MLYCLVGFLQPCDHLLGKDLPLGSLVCDVSLCFVTFPYGVSGKVWVLSVLIPDLCLLFFTKRLKTKNIIVKIGFPNVKIERSPNVNKTFNNVWITFILLPG